MKRIAFAILALIATIYTFAQDQNKLKIYGELMTDERILYDNGDWIWNENRLTLNMEKTILNNSKFYSEVWFRNIGLPEYYKFADLYNKNVISPWNLELRQAYATVYGLLGGKLDLTVGKQIINWGTADKFNPTNNLNPYDFEDVLDFGRKRGSFAIKADFYFNSDNYIELAYLPFFQPDNLPIGPFAELLSPLALAQEQSQIPITSFSDSLALPELTFKNGIFGVRFKGFLAGFDYSFSYVYGYDGLPYPDSTHVLVNVISLQPQVYAADVKATLSYYRRHIFGFDFAGNLAGVGLWGEFALYMTPDDVVSTTVVDYTGNLPFPMPTQRTDSIILEKNKPYLKFVLGADYTFANGIYLNVQYLHGFIHERTKDELNDYLVVRAEYSMFNDKLKIAPISGVVVVSDWNDLKNNVGFAYFPQLIYKPTDNFELSIAVAYFGGKGKSFLPQLKDWNFVGLRAKYSF